MSSLPQRKKTAEEIAQLREQLGVTELIVAPAAQPSVAPAAQPSVVPAAARAASTAQHAATATTLPPAREAAPATAAAPPVETSPPFEAGPGPVNGGIPQPKICRSLKKSEQVPVEYKPAPVRLDSKLPVHRHSDEEIEEIRRREMLSQLHPTPPNRKFVKAHPALPILGYLLAVAGSTIFWRKDFPWAATVACCAGALLLALYLFLRTPVSRHHAGFIAVGSVMVIIFASLQQFPQLQHAT